MKSKISKLCLTLMLVLLLIPLTLANAQSPQAKVILNGKTVDFNNPAIVVNGNTMVPFREVFSLFGMKVEWNSKTHTASAVKDGVILEITADQMTAKVNGKDIPLSQSAFISGDNNSGTFYVHLRLISEAMGASVGWNQATRTVTITTKDANGN